MSQLEITCQQVSEKLNSDDEFLLLDCRETDEFETVHIDKSTLIPMSELAERISELDAHRESEIIVYCHHGGRSLRVTNWLLQQGFKNVKSMAGGIDQWAIEIDPSLERY